LIGPSSIGYIEHDHSEEEEEVRLLERVLALVLMRWMELEIWEKKKMQKDEAVG
jgi:hypothetical protein